MRIWSPAGITVAGTPLDWRSSLAVRNHSTTGPAWSCGDSGPARPALDAAGAFRCETAASGSTGNPVRAQNASRTHSHNEVPYILDRAPDERDRADCQT